MKCFPTTDDFQLLIKNAFACAIHCIVCRHCKRCVWEFCYSLQSFHFVFSSHATCSPAYSKSCKLQPKTLKSVTTLFIAFRSVVVVAFFSPFSYFLYFKRGFLLFRIFVRYWWALKLKIYNFLWWFKAHFREAAVVISCVRSFVHSLSLYFCFIHIFFLLGGMRPVLLFSPKIWR